MLFGEGRPAEVLYWLDTYRSNETNEGGKILGWCFLDECDALDADSAMARLVMQTEYSTKYLQNEYSR